MREKIIDEHVLANMPSSAYVAQNKILILFCAIDADDAADGIFAETRSSIICVPYFSYLRVGYCFLEQFMDLSHQHIFHFSYPIAMFCAVL